MNRFPPGFDRFDGEGRSIAVVRDAGASWAFGLQELLLLLLLLAVLALVAISLVRLERESRTNDEHAEPEPPAPPRQVATRTPVVRDAAVDELRARYARGDVSADDYRRTFDDLTGATTPTWPGPAEGREPAT